VPGYGNFGYAIGPFFHRYAGGHRFAKLACDLVEKYGFIAYQAKIYRVRGHVAVWSQPIARGIDFTRAAFRIATETGDLTYACYSAYQSVSALLLQNDPLDAVWRQSEIAPDFARKAKFRDMVDVFVSLQRFIETMRGRTATFSTFSDVQFHKAAFEAHLTGDRMSLMICWYWIL
jgi:predicted ATPase